MLVIRGANRAAHPITQACSLEFQDAQGRIAVAVTQSGTGSVKILTPGDPEFAAYCRSVGAMPSPVIVHENVKPTKL